MDPTGIRPVMPISEASNGLPNSKTGSAGSNPESPGPGAGTKKLALALRKGHDRGVFEEAGQPMNRARNLRSSTGFPVIAAWTVILAVLGAMAPMGLATEPVKARNPEALWEISKSHLKNPFLWPSVWKGKPQAQDAAEMAGWKEGQAPIAEPPPVQEETTAPKPKNDWRASEEKRTQNYLTKVGPLNDAIIRPVTQAAEPVPWQGPSDQTPALHYLAGSLLLATPFIGDALEGGGLYPGECRIQYSSANESSILQMFDEIVLSVGKEQGAKAGDLYRTYEVGPSYRSFATGRALGRLVETNGIVEIVRAGTRSSVARLIKCYGTLSRDTRACPLGRMQEVTAAGYAPLPDARTSAQVVWVTQQQQLPQPYSFAIVDQGARKGFRMGDMILFFNRNSGRMTEKVLGNGLVVNVQEEACTVLIQELFPGIINRGDYVVAIQTPVL